ncbi:P-type ATPase [Chytridiales sp. JEL 0842]|nr:P-type ATPase [Chytridiales sp. JEL 0842]
MDKTNENDHFELRSVSVKLDGRASIEHQIDIHVLDLVELADNKDILLMDVLQGLKYVMDYRIVGGKMQHLDPELMKRLAEGLLQNMGHEEGSLLRRRPTEEADLAFTLFREFLDEVEEFRDAVGTKSSTDLRHAMKIHRRCQSWSTPEQKETAAAILHLLATFVQFEDWKDLVKPEEHSDAEAVMKEYPAKFKGPGDDNTIGTSDLHAVPTHSLYPPPALYFDKNAEKLAAMFGCDIEKGLPSSKVPDLARHYGPNKLPEPPKASILWMLWTQLTDFMVMILIVAAVVDLIIGDPKAAVVLLAVVVLNVIIGFSQEYKANAALEALLTLSVPKATVIRDGKQEVIESRFLVPGDLVVLEEGDAVPADLRLCEVAQLEIVEAILTGESVPCAKSVRTIRKRTRKLPLGDCKGSAFMTTVVARGRGKGIVVRTGVDTEIGRISKAITSTPNEQTPIQRKLSILGKILVVIAIVLCAVVVGIGIGYKNDPLEMAKVGVSLAVSTIPEGLVAIVTVTMAIAVSRMASRNAIVRKLPSVETLGSVTHICSDKTGTLTEGKMTATELWTSDNSIFTYTNEGNGVSFVSVCPRVAVKEAVSDPSKYCGNGHDDGKSEATKVAPDVASAPSLLVTASMIAALCNNAVVENAAIDISNSGKEAEPEAKVSGDPTEIALVVASQNANFAKEWFKEAVGMEKIGEYAFDSERKLMSVIYKQNTPSKPEYAFPADTSFVFVKGAPEGVLHRCKFYMPPFNDSADSPNVARGDGQFFTHMSQSQPEPLSDEYVNYISDRSVLMAGQGLRVLALAMKKVSNNEAQRIIDSKKQEAAESELVFVGLIGLIDPPKLGVKESVTQCKNAGIKVIMITGDHIATASAIATQLGILDVNGHNNSRVMKGVELDLISEESLAAMRPFPVVFARVSPDNKLKIVKALQSLEYSVAMTGDGVNDAPAIKKANVGVAMGIGGTEITKQAADIVLADDNFSTIVEAVREGRQVFDNIKKFIVYLLSCNSAEIFLFLITAIMNIKLPFTIIQILWANIIADIPPAMSLGVEPPELNIMDRPPRPPREGVLTGMTSSIILIQGFTQSLATLAVYLLARADIIPQTNSSLAADRSLAFTCLTTMQILQSFLSRSVELSIFTTGIFGNTWLIIAFVISFGGLVLGLYIPGLNAWLELEPFGFEWVAILLCCIFQITVVEIMKYCVRYISSKRNAHNWEEEHLRALKSKPARWWRFWE